MRELTVVLALLVSVSAFGKTWTRTDGTTFEAELEKASAGNAHFVKADGSKVAMPIRRLAAADQAAANAAVPGKAGAPAAPVAGAVVSDEVKKLFGTELLNAKKKKLGIEHLAGKKVIGVYFSAHWCPPCRQFTPKLVDFANEMEKAGKPFEVVFASSDRSVKDMYKYMTDTKMPWVAVPHRGPISAALSQTYGVRGIPALIIIDEDGKVLSKNGRGDVMSNGAKAYEIWTQ